MQARVSASCKWGIVTAFGGREYVRYEWRNVPHGNEEKAQQHPMLETKTPDVADEPIIDKPKPTRKVRGKRNS